MIYLISREIKINLSKKTDIFTELIFFVISLSLFPLAVSNDPVILHKIAPGVFWISALFAVMLSLGKMFVNDYRDGTIEQLILTDVTLLEFVYVKILIHWIFSCLPLIILTPLLSLQYNLTYLEVYVLLVSFLVGTPLLSTIGAVGAAITLSAKNANILMPVLVLPLYIPVLIFGVSGLVALQTGLSYLPSIYILLGLFFGGIFILPFCAYMALKISID